MVALRYGSLNEFFAVMSRATEGTCFLGFSVFPEGGVFCGILVNECAGILAASTAVFFESDVVVDHAV